MTREALLARYAAGERNFSGLDLSGLDLSNIKDEIRRAEDHYAFLRENYPLNRCIFRGANFSYVNFSGTCIMHCDFRDTTFRGANLSHCAFSGSNFTGTDMREVTLTNGEGIGVIFENTNFQGAKGSFVHEGTLCLRNCIGRGGKFIELLNEETVMRELNSRYVDEWNGIPMDQIQRIGLSNTWPLNTQTIDEDSIPF
ncbi:pentapeptide repeat-containing protein [Aphanothece hegewaldii]|uniref:pentapeptide repeat-containing protein n=1 Tax=Aphanothece hegewaldii TaxID=1521625 RepID=UPI003CCBCC36